MNPANSPARIRRRNLRGDIVFAFAVCFAIYLAWVLRDVLLLLYVSALFAVALKPVVGFIGRLRIGRWHPFQRSAILVLLLLIAGGLATFAFLAIPPVASDLHDFAQEMPTRMPPFIAKLKSIPLIGRVDLSAVTARVEDQMTHAATYLFLSIRNWAGYVAKVGMCLILTVYFDLEGNVAYAWCLSFFAPEGRARLDTALQRAGVRMENSFLTPRIMRSSVGLPGLSILVALLVGSELAGVVGALVSVPTAVLVTVLVDEYLIARET